jgi:hypothetical protein
VIWKGYVSDANVTNPKIPNPTFSHLVLYLHGATTSIHDRPSKPPTLVEKEENLQSQQFQHCQLPEVKYFEV